jgi:hypothetical protein
MANRAIAAVAPLNLDHFVEARAALCRRLVEARAERFGRPIKGPEFDDDGMTGAVDDPPAPPIAFHLIYHDAKRELSGRCVTLRNLKHEHTEIRVTAFCHMRHALRTFVASRIVEVTDLSTGEVDEDGLAYFRRHPLLQGPSSDCDGRSSDLMAVQECRDEIIVLSFVAAADGWVDAGEQDEIVKHVMNRWPEEGVTEAGVRQRVRSWVPDERAFWRALTRLSAGEGDAKALMRSLRRVVDADGVIGSEEVAFVGEIEARLRSAGQI